MDSDFQPTEPHPFASRTEASTGETLSRAEDFYLHKDTLGTLVIERTDSDTVSALLHAFAFLDAEGCKGNATCQYNGFNELTDLWMETPSMRTHSMLQWDEDGNLQTINQETWLQSDEDGTQPVHTMTFIHYSYSQHSGYGNWYAGMAEQIAGPVAEALHYGRMGRAPWTLPDNISYVSSDIQGDMIGEQKSHSCQPQYDYDNNGRVITERLIHPDNTQTYTYTYY